MKLIKKYQEGGNPWGVHYKPSSEHEIRYNADGTVIPLWFYEWAPKGAKRDDIAPGYMFESGENPNNFTIGNLYDEYWDKSLAYNRAINKRNHPERFWDTYHDMARKSGEPGSTEAILGDAIEGLAGVFNKGVGTVMSIPIEAQKAFMLPGYIPYYGSNGPLILQLAEAIDKGLFYATAPTMWCNWIDWGRLDDGKIHFKWAWDENTGNAKTPETALALSIISFPYILKGAGTATRGISGAAPRMYYRLRGKGASVGYELGRAIDETPSSNFVYEVDNTVSNPYKSDGYHMHMIYPHPRTGELMASSDQRASLYRSPTGAASKNNPHNITYYERKPYNFNNFTPNIWNFRNYAKPIDYGNPPSNYNVYMDYNAIPMLEDNVLRAIHWMPEKLLSIAEEYVRTGDFKTVMENKGLTLEEKKMIADLGRMNSYVNSGSMNSYYENLGDLLDDHPYVAKGIPEHEMRTIRRASGGATKSSSGVPLKFVGKKDNLSTKVHEGNHNVQHKFGMSENLQKALHKAFPHPTKNYMGQRISGNSLRESGSSALINEKGSTAADMRSIILEDHKLPLDTPMELLNKIIDSMTNEELLDVLKEAPYGRDYFRAIMELIDTYDFDNLRLVIKYGYKKGGKIRINATN